MENQVIAIAEPTFMQNLGREFSKQLPAAAVTLGLMAGTYATIRYFFFDEKKDEQKRVAAQNSKFLRELATTRVSNDILVAYTEMSDPIKTAIDTLRAGNAEAETLAALRKALGGVL